MTSTHDGDSVISSGPNPRSRRTLSSRFGSIFGSKASHINSYHLELDDPVRYYSPGDHVKGKVVLDVGKPLGITHVVVTLLGYVQVFKSNTRPKLGYRANGVRVATGNGKRWSSEYYGDGYASLFEDEAVLCGEGRLDPKLYHFKFDLQFPTSSKLPSSIEFERGAISYLVMATITRPTTIAPTISREHRVFFRDSIDIATLPEPKPRIVTLEPIRKHGKKSPLKRLASHTASSMPGSVRESISSHGEDSVTSGRSSTPTQSADSNRPQSPSRQSTISFASSTVEREAPAQQQTSSESQSSQNGQSQGQSQKSEHDSREGSNSGGSTANKIITASVQLSRVGGLPGEMVPLIVTVNHTKQIRSLNGVIVTLYRQARVDAHPNLPIGPADGSAPRYEDYYPRSRTGLGGLSLSAAGSSQVWRKDLAQSFAPLYIDPRNMSAQVKVAIRIPEDAFPTIRNAPGDMISFKYIVEVILDIHGKLAHHTSQAQTAKSPSGNQTYSRNFTSTGLDDVANHGTLSSSSQCIDTSQMRRDRNAVVCLCDLVVGTRDSAKKAGKQKALGSDVALEYTPNSYGSMSPSPNGSAAQWQSYWGYEPGDSSAIDAATAYENGYGYDEYYDEGYDDSTYYPDGYDYSYDPNWAGYDPRYYSHTNNQTLGSPHHHLTHNQPSNPHNAYQIPPTDFREETGLSEKEQLRRAEERLLPSQPPLEAAGSEQQEATAPALPDEAVHPVDHARVARHDYVNGAPSHSNIAESPPPSFAAAQASAAVGDGASSSSINGASASPQSPTDDKQEMERRRLLAQASAPPADGELEDDLVTPLAPPPNTVTNGVSSSRHSANAELERQGSVDNLPLYER